jgi:broad specificity phosphatase PhoE
MVGGHILARQLIYLRHGETDWNVEGRCLGQADSHLTERGRQQAERARPQIATLGSATIFHSPLIRAAETARIIARDGQSRLVCEPDLKECRLGDKEGCLETDPTDNFVVRWAKGGHIPNAEPYAEFRQRVIRGINRCLRTADAAPLIIVAHSAVFWALLDVMSISGHDIEHCTPVRFVPTAGGWIEERV